MKCLVAVVLLSASAQAVELGVITSTPSVAVGSVAVSVPTTAILDDLIVTAVARSLSYRSAKLDALTANAAFRESDSFFEPRFDAALTKSGSVTRLRAVPDSLPNPVTARSHSATATVSKRTSIGTVLSVGAASTGAQTDPFIKRYDGAVTVGVSQPLLDGAWRAGAYAAAKQALLAARAADASLYRSYETMIAGVESSYWALRRAEARRVAATQSRLNAEHLLRRNQELNRRKLMSDFDVIVAESGALTQRASDTDAARARADAVDALVYLAFGEEAPRTLRGDFDLATTTASDRALPAVPTEEEAEDAALAARRDLAAARLAHERAGVAKRAASLSLWPSLGVNGSYSSAGAAQTGRPGDLELSVRDAYRGGRGSAWTAGVTLGVPLGNGADRARYEAAQAELERRRLALVDAENSIRQETRAARRAVIAAFDRRADTERAAQLAERQLQGEYRRLDLNLSDSFRVLQQVDNLTRARLSLADVQFELLDAITRFDLALGRVAERYAKPEATR